MTLITALDFIRTLLISLSKVCLSSQSQLQKENALLRHQLLVLKRQSRRPQFSWFDHLIFCFGSKKIKNIASICVIFRPSTLFKWHKKLIAKKWSYAHGRPPGRPKTDIDIEKLIIKLKKENKTWGSPRIHGELLKLNIDISQTTVRNILKKHDLDKFPHEQYLSWCEFIRRHKKIWAVDFFTIETALLKTVYVFAIIDIHKREIIDLRVLPDSPNREWVENILRHNFGYNNQPEVIIRDGDGAYGGLANTSGVKIVKTPPRSPQYNTYVERLIGSVRRECTNHFLYFTRRQIQESLNEYKEYFNNHRPHQGINQKIPLADESLNKNSFKNLKDVMEKEFLGGLHHSYSTGG